MITDYKKNTNFVDEQLKGPYAFWHHTHTFIESNDGTQINDKVLYSMPFGVFGTIAHFMFVKRSLHKIFNFRQETMNKIFPSTK